jgi:BMFP domain-containing protein YqiC
MEVKLHKITEDFNVNKAVLKKERLETEKHLKKIQDLEGKNDWLEIMKASFERTIEI